MAGISKSFGSTPVLSDVGLTAWPQEVHALVGENGAGKSTLMKILSGVYPRDSGSIRIAGEEVSFSSPHDSRRRGISMIFQEHTLAGDLTVAENIFLGVEPSRGPGVLNNRAIETRAAQILESHRFPLLPRTRVARLTRAEKQMVEIARALVTASRVVVMDEPTAVLSQAESDELFRIIGGLKARGMAVIYISHRMEELERIADRITILRNGRHVYTGAYHSLDRSAVIRHMVGRDIQELYPALAPASDQVALEARALSGAEYRGISFALRRGEVLGLAGLVGSGRTALARGLFGLEPPAAGMVLLRGERVHFHSPAEAIAGGVGYLTEDRKATSIFPELSLAQNISMAGLALRGGPLLDLHEERRRCAQLIRQLDIRARSEAQPIHRLSGGNQQKAVFARWLFAGSEVLILDEPTQGVDLGARAEIYRLIRDIAARGAAVLMISSDLPELLGMSHRVAVMRRGELVATLPAAGTSQEEILRYAALERQ
jgi:ABC-type sugar transport system ATPase subunit